MAWYDQLADNPQKALDDLAAQRGVTRAELDRRRDLLIRIATTGGPHLTLNELDELKVEAPALSATAVDHYQVCAYCRELVNAVAPTAIEKHANLLRYIPKQRKFRQWFAKRIRNRFCA